MQNSDLAVEKYEMWECGECGVVRPWGTGEGTITEDKLLSRVVLRCAGKREGEGCGGRVTTHTFTGTKFLPVRRMWPEEGLEWADSDDLRVEIYHVDHEEETCTSYKK